MLRDFWSLVINTLTSVYKYVSNPGANASPATNTGNQRTFTTFQSLSAGSHTIYVRTAYKAGVSALVSSDNTAARQGSSYH